MGDDGQAEMDEIQQGVVMDIRALLLSSKKAISIGDLSRDYETFEQHPIPYKKFNHPTLESFLRSVPSLRVMNSGRDIVVEAIPNQSTAHISHMVNKQRSSGHKPSSLVATSNRGRGSYRGGRGRYHPTPTRYTQDKFPTKEYPPANRQLSHPGPTKEYPPANRHSSHTGPTKEYPPANRHSSHPGPTKEYPPANRQLSHPGPTKEYTAANKQSIHPGPTKEYTAANKQSIHPGPTKEYNAAPPRQTYPKNEVLRINNGTEVVENLVVNVNNDDKRQVSVGDSDPYSSLRDNRYSRLPPRFQKIRQQLSNNVPTPSGSQMSSVNNLTYDIDNSLYLDSPNDDIDRSLQEVDTNIISALNPSQMVEVGRRKEQSIAACVQYGEPPCVPIPDEANLSNNIELLRQYLSAMNWPEPEYTEHERMSKGRRAPSMWSSTVKIIKNGEEKKYISYPFESVEAISARGYAAKRALEELQKEQKVMESQTIISTNKSIIIDRISKIVADAHHGLFSTRVEDLYIENYKEKLPSDWISTLENDCRTISVDHLVKNQTIIVPRNLDQYFDPLPTAQVPLDPVPPESEEWDVFVTAALSTTNVWFRLIGENYSEKYEILLQKMEEFYITNGVNQLALTIDEGMYYAAETTDGWFRICVTSINDESKTVTANLIDYGETDIFGFKNLYNLPNEFCELPRQAIQCSLYGLESLRKEDLFFMEDCFAEHLIGKVFVAVINPSDNKTESVSVTLYDTSSEDGVPENVNEKIKELFASNFESKVPLMPEERRAQEVLVSHVSKLGDIYVQIPAPTNGCDYFKYMAETIESLDPETISVNKLTSYRQVRANKIYLAQYSKGHKWFRAVITSPPSVQQNKIALQFVDYGNSETVTINELVDVDNLPLIISKLPPQAVKVALNNLTPDVLSSSQITKLHSLLLGDDKVLLMRLVAFQEGMPLVDMFYKDNGGTGAIVSVNLTIDDMELSKPRSMTYTSKEMPSSELSNGNSGCQLSRPKIKENSFHLVQVNLASNPGHFYFQFKKHDSDIEKLMTQLQNFYNSRTLPQLKKEDIFSGRYYVGRHEDSWFRMVVTESTFNQFGVPVWLCDFGQLTCVPVSNLRSIHSDFLELPCMAIKGKLSGIEPEHKDWTVEDCLRFQELVLKKPMTACIVNVEEGLDNAIDYIVGLKLRDPDIDVNIADILCEEKRAVYKT